MNNDTRIKTMMAELVAQRDSGLNALAEMKGLYAEVVEERDRLKAELETLKPKETTNGD